MFLKDETLWFIVKFFAQVIFKLYDIDIKR